MLNLQQTPFSGYTVSGKWKICELALLLRSRGIHARVFPGFWEVRIFVRTLFCLCEQMVHSEGASKFLKVSLINFRPQNTSDDLFVFKERHLST